MPKGGLVSASERRPAPETRLRRAAEFEHVLAHARRAASRNFYAWAQPNDQGHARLGIIAGRKAAPRAVDRNRGKRLIREWFRATMTQLSGLDVIVQLRTPLRDADNAALRAEMHELLKKVCAARAQQHNGR